MLESDFKVEISLSVWYVQRTTSADISAVDDDDDGDNDIGWLNINTDFHPSRAFVAGSELYSNLEMTPDI